MAEPDERVVDEGVEAEERDERGELPDVPARGERRLTRRQKVVRGGGAGLAVLLAVTVLAAQLGLLWMPDVGALWQNARAEVQLLGVPRLEGVTITPGQWRTVAGMGWERVALLGADDGTLRSFWPASDDAAAVYACRGVAGREAINPDVGPMTFWRTRDSGRTWQQLKTPAVTGRYCNVMTAPDAPRRVFAQMEDQDCPSTRVLVSDDGGDTWRSVESLPPLPEHAEQCGAIVLSTARSLYVTYNTQFNMRNVQQGDTTTFAYSLMTADYRSDDDGKSWTKEWETTFDSLHPASPAATPRFSPYTVLTDGKSEVQTAYLLDERGAIADTILWTTTDAGKSWRALGILPGMYDSELVSGAQSVEPTQANPIYLTRSAAEPGALFRIQIAQITDGAHWAPLPPLPVAGAMADRLGITRLLGVTASGKLLALGVGPGEQVPGEGDQSVLNQEPVGFGEHLWMWDAGAGRWTYIVTPMPPSEGQCADTCWDGQVSVGNGPQGHGTYLWLREGFPAEAQVLYRMYLPGV